MSDSKMLYNIEMLIAPILEENKYCLIDKSFCFQRGRWVLKLLVDKIYGGISLDECASLNNQISEILDANDLIKESYILEVCSPGLDRPLKKSQDFKRCIDRKVVVYTCEPVKGKTEHSGLIKDIDENFLYLDIDDRRFQIPLDKIRKAKQLIEE